MSQEKTDKIVVIGASEHNLKNVSLEIPRNTLTVFTGVSGSGKSSLAFDTIFKEGQRRFVESLSAYARQFLGQSDKPRVEHMEGLSPTISVDQKTVNRSSRSTVGTVTEVTTIIVFSSHVWANPTAQSVEHELPHRILNKLLIMPTLTD